MRKIRKYITLISICSSLSAMPSGNGSIPSMSSSPNSLASVQMKSELTAQNLSKLHNELFELTRNWDLDSTSTNLTSDALQKDLQNALNHQKESSDLLAQNVNDLSKLQKLENENHKLNMENTDLKTENDLLHIKLKNAQEKVKYLEEENSVKTRELKERYNSLERSLSTSTKRHETKDLSIAEMREKLEKQTSLKELHEIKAESLQAELNILESKYNQQSSEARKNDELLKFELKIANSEAYVNKTACELYKVSLSDLSNISIDLFMEYLKEKSLDSKIDNDKEKTIKSFLKLIKESKTYDKLINSFNLFKVKQLMAENPSAVKLFSSQNIK
ncbi:hypothetical protein [Candidatus Nesciobacter abundans]|uniref:Uncharacterized protein n=1 Tax=Candidatus Nesciobacter abundans TaxID=2601668 RepID=A0A5C0UFR8_9PROT|nr:hypothetical protein [Candidatus Nesciobacter abundans]QEK38935.1 hypothetical protein FZC36_00585 [Candidatus Nesciobacter abundans]